MEPSLYANDVLTGEKRKGREKSMAQKETPTIRKYPEVPLKRKTS